MNTRSLAFRLGAWYTLLLAVTFLLVGTATYYGLRHYVRGNLAESLSRRLDQVQTLLLSAPASSSEAEIQREIELQVAPSINNRFVRVSRLPDAWVYQSAMPADASFNPQRVPPQPESRSMRLIPEGGVAVIVRSISASSGHYKIEVGLSTGSMDAALDGLFQLLLLLLPALLICAAVGGYALVNRALLPVDQLSATAETMSWRDLTLRLPVLKSGDALERLSISFNNMLSRLNESVDTSRRFLADASHELRTPLTVVKGELQELIGPTPLISLPHSVVERIGSVLEEVARLEHLVSGLLTISRLDAGVTATAWSDVDLGKLGRDTAEQMRLLAEDREVELDLSGLADRCVVRGDSAQLKQVIVNLLDNAIRYTSPGGYVTITANTSLTSTVLSVSDTGAGIPAESLPRIFERFYRVDPARSREDGGAGLGLSIVKALCTLHAASIDVQSTPAKGTRVSVSFTATASSSSSTRAPKR